MAWTRRAAVEVGGRGQAVATETSQRTGGGLSPRVECGSPEPLCWAARKRKLGLRCGG